MNPIDFFLKPQSWSQSAEKNSEERISCCYNRCYSLVVHRMVERTIHTGRSAVAIVAELSSCLWSCWSREVGRNLGCSTAGSTWPYPNLTTWRPWLQRS